MDLKNVLRNLKMVFRNLRYLLLAFVIAFLFYTLNVLIANFSNLVSLYPSLGLLGTIKIFLFMITGFFKLVKLHSFTSLIIISILFGIFFSLISYKLKFMKAIDNKKIGFFASVGLFLGILAPGCAACGIGLLSVLGFGATFLIFLPFEGLELSILAIAILSIVIFKTSENLTNCKVKLNGRKS